MKQAVILLSVFALVVTPAVTAEHLEVREVYPLPAELGMAVDVRWADDDSLFVAAVDQGTWRLDLVDDRWQAAAQVDEGRWTSRRMPALFLGGSADLLAIGSAQGYAWRAPRRDELGFSGRIDWILDFDSWRGEVAFLGQRRSTSGEFCFDDGLAWRGPLRAGLATLDVVADSDTGCRAMNVCGSYSVGALRFLDDGSLLVIPGVEDGVRLYGRSGALLQEWNPAQLGLEAGCDLRHGARISGDAAYRKAFLNARSTAEEILPLPGNRAGVVVRRLHRQTRTPRWELAVLTPGLDWVERIPVPLDPGSPHTLLRGDVRGRQLALLLVGTQPGEGFALVLATLVEEDSEP